MVELTKEWVNSQFASLYKNTPLQTIELEDGYIVDIGSDGPNEGDYKVCKKFEIGKPCVHNLPPNEWQTVSLMWKGIKEPLTDLEDLATNHWTKVNNATGPYGSSAVYFAEGALAAFVTIKFLPKILIFFAGKTAQTLFTSAFAALTTLNLASMANDFYKDERGKAWVGAGNTLRDAFFIFLSAGGSISRLALKLKSLLRISPRDIELLQQELKAVSKTARPDVVLEGMSLAGSTGSVATGESPEMLLVLEVIFILGMVFVYRFLPPVKNKNAALIAKIRERYPNLSEKEIIAAIDYARDMINNQKKVFAKHGIEKPSPELIAVSYGLVVASLMQEISDSTPSKAAMNESK